MVAFYILPLWTIHRQSHESHSRSGSLSWSQLYKRWHISWERQLRREAYQVRTKIALQHQLNPTCWKLLGLAGCWGTGAGLNWFCCKFVAGFELLARFNLLSTNWFKLFSSLSLNFCRPGLFCCCGVNLCVEAGLWDLWGIWAKFWNWFFPDWSNLWGCTLVRGCSNLWGCTLVLGWLNLCGTAVVLGCSNICGCEVVLSCSKTWAGSNLCGCPKPWGCPNRWGWFWFCPTLWRWLIVCCGTEGMRLDWGSLLLPRFLPADWANVWPGRNSPKIVWKSPGFGREPPWDAPELCCDLKPSSKLDSELKLWESPPGRDRTPSCCCGTASSTWVGSK